MSRGLISAAKLLPDTEIKAAPRGGCQAKEKARIPPSPNPNAWVMCHSQGVKTLLDHQPDADSDQVRGGQQITPGSLSLALNLLFPLILIQLLEIKSAGAFPLSPASYCLPRGDKTPGSPSSSSSLLQLSSGTDCSGPFHHHLHHGQFADVPRCHCPQRNRVRLSSSRQVSRIPSSDLCWWR